MANPLAEEARTLTDEDLSEAINEAYREMFNLQFQRGTRQLQNPMALKAARRQIARLRTILRERQRAEALGAPIAPLASAPEASVSPQRRAAEEARAAAAVEEDVDDAVGGAVDESDAATASVADEEEGLLESAESAVESDEESGDDGDDAGREREG